MTVQRYLKEQAKRLDRFYLSNNMEMYNRTILKIFDDLTDNYNKAVDYVKKLDESKEKDVLPKVP